jgi:hypothetical protein
MVSMSSAVSAFPTKSRRRALAVASAALLAGAAAPRPPMPHYDHIFVIVEENQGLADILGKPFTPRLTAFARQYGVATHYYGIVHPSEANYIAMLAGNTFGIHDDDAYYCKPHMKDPACKDSDTPGFVDHTIDTPSLADQLTAHHLTWKGYNESLPSPGAMDVIWPKAGNPEHLPTGLYASKHAGFNAFKSGQTDPQRAQHIVNFEVLDQDLALDQMPNFALIVPNQCNEMHGIKGENVPPDCTKENEPGRIARGDTYAGQLVDRIMHSPVWTDKGNTAIVITFDEASHHIYPGDPAGCCAYEPGSPANFGGGRIATIVITNHGPRALQDPTPYNHYSLLRTVEDGFGIQEHLGHAADEAKGVVSMTPLFSTTP